MTRPSIEDRLLSRHRVDPDTDCWEWTGAKNGQGYGQMKTDGRTSSVHRLAFVLWVGPIPDDRPFILHTCDNPPCINPAHLYAGTQQQNMADMARRGRVNSANIAATRQASVTARRARTHCKHGHEYTEENTRWRSDGSRACKECKRQALRRHRAGK